MKSKSNFLHGWSGTPTVGRTKDGEGKFVPKNIKKPSAAPKLGKRKK